MSGLGGHDLRVLLVRRREFCLAAMNKLLANNPLFHTNWIVPRNVMCILFWTGVFVVFIGMILLVTSKHRGAAFLSWGGVVLGLGLCLLIVCLMLCIHAYCVVANASRSEDSVTYASPVVLGTEITIAEENMQNSSHFNLDQSKELPTFKSKSRPSAVRFNLVDNCHQFGKELESTSNLSLKTTFATEKYVYKNDHYVPANRTEGSIESSSKASDYKKQERSPSNHSIDKNKLDNVSHAKKPNEILPGMSMTRSFGASKITVTPIKHNHYEYRLGRDEANWSQTDSFSTRFRAIQQGHIVTGNRPEFNPLFPDKLEGEDEEQTINESELHRFPLMEIGDSKATVYDNVQYYRM